MSSCLCGPASATAKDFPRHQASGPVVGLLLATTIALALVLPAPVAAQFDQYTEPGRFDEQRQSTQEQLVDAIQRAPWRVGRFYAAPWLGLRDVAYIDNVRGSGEGAPTQSDITATIGAGLRLYRPVGPEAIFAAHALPEYVWWQDLSERSRVNGRYGVGLFGNFGRTGVELSATRTEDSRFFSREVEVRANTRDDIAALDLEIDLGAGIALFTGLSLRESSYLDQDDAQLRDLDLLDRDETILRAGLRFELGAGLRVGVGAEQSIVGFDAPSPASSRSNEGLSPILQLDFAGAFADLTAQLAWRDLEARDGSAFVPFEDVTGRAQVGFRRAGRIRPQLFASRNLVYSLDPRWAYFTDTGYGLAVVTSLGARGSVRLFGESGSNDYAAFASSLADRSDDFDALGATFAVRLGRTTFQLGITRTEYRSNLPGFDRTVTVLRSGVGLGGRGGSVWG